MADQETPGKRLDTRFDLVAELERLPKSPEIDFIIQEAKAGEYHDYKNEKYACGKVEASAKLRAVGLIPLAKRIENGDFDEVADEEDKAKMRADLPERAWDMFGLRPGQGPTASDRESRGEK